MSLLQTLLDPQRRAKAAEDQDKLRSTMGHRVARNLAQANYLYGVARERMALDQLASRGDDLHLYSQLAESLALQGRFAEAVAIAPESDERREAYAAKLAAVERVGELACEHPLTLIVDGKEEPQHLPLQRVWNGKVTVQFARCRACKAVSANA